MKLSDRLRHYAKENLDLAKASPEGELRQIYLQNAEAWIRMAAAHDRRNEPPPGKQERRVDHVQSIAA